MNSEKDKRAANGDVTQLRARPAENFSSPVSQRSSRPADVTAILQKKEWAFLRVSGKSMTPWIREGDIVFLRRSRIFEVARGDVVVFEKASALCVHRVLAVRGHASDGERHVSLVTKGDATADADASVFCDAFLGKVEFVYRHNKEIRIAHGWRKYFGKVLSLLSPAVGWSRLLTAKTDRNPARFGQRSTENSAD